MMQMAMPRRFTLVMVLVLLAVIMSGVSGLWPRMTAPAGTAVTGMAAARHLPIVFARSDGPPAAMELLNGTYRGAVLLAAEIYDGIHLVLRGAAAEPVYDLVVRPHARPDRIRLWVAGAERLAVDEAGELVVHHAGRQSKQPRPRAYQQTPEGDVDVRADYRVGPDGHVRFAFGKYDRSRALVITPVSFLSGQFARTREP